MKYLSLLLLFISLNCFGQNYKSQIAAFRDKYKSDFLTDASSPLKQEDLQNLRFYNADSTYRVTATVEMLSGQTPFIMPAFSGAGQRNMRYAVLHFTLKNKAMQLTLYKSIDLANIPSLKDYLFLPFTDDTNGHDTYTGGRYIDMREGDIKNGTAVVDFNKAYNPYCAFSAGYACPKPPDENHLTAAIEAGEKSFAGEKKH